MKLRSRAQCRTQFNCAAVKCSNHFIKVNSKLVAFVKFHSPLCQDIGKSWQIRQSFFSFASARVDLGIIFSPERYKSCEYKSRAVSMSLSPLLSVNGAKLITRNWSPQLNLIACLLPRWCLIHMRNSYSGMIDISSAKIVFPLFIVCAR